MNWWASRDKVVVWLRGCFTSKKWEEWANRQCVCRVHWCRIDTHGHNKLQVLWRVRRKAVEILQQRGRESKNSRICDTDASPSSRRLLRLTKLSAVVILFLLSLAESFLLQNILLSLLQLQKAPHTHGAKSTNARRENWGWSLLSLSNLILRMLKRPSSFSSSSSLSLSDGASWKMTKAMKEAAGLEE